MLGKLEWFFHIRSPDCHLQGSIYAKGPTISHLDSGFLVVPLISASHRGGSQFTSCYCMLPMHPS